LTSSPLTPTFMCIENGVESSIRSIGSRVRGSLLIDTGADITRRFVAPSGVRERKTDRRQGRDGLPHERPTARGSGSPTTPS
jgi:hypothetical protein